MVFFDNQLKDGEGKFSLLKKENMLIFTLVGILLLVIAIPVGNGKDKKKSEEKSISEEKTQQVFTDNQDNYALKLQKQMEDILSSMDGVGKVKVMITLKSSEETVYMENTRGNKVPYVIKTNEPEIEGVTVVAQGGGNPIVCTNISNVVKALFHIELNKIAVVKMKDGNNR